VEVIKLDLLKIVGLNVKYYRYLKHWTQEDLSDNCDFKISYISLIERCEANMTLKNIEYLAKILDVSPDKLLVEETALKAKKLPNRVDLFTN